jgi:rubrerythrin
VSFPEVNTEGHFCRLCGVHRTRTAVGICPVCDDEAKRLERIAATPRPVP